MSSPSSGTNRFLLIQWAVVAAAVVLVLGAGFATATANGDLRRLLARWTVLSLEASFCLMVVLLVALWRDLRSLFGGLSRAYRWTLCGLLAAGLGMVAFVTPCTNRIYFDEHIYENIAQNIAWTGKAFMCNEGNAEHGEYKAFATEYNKQPNGHPFYVSVFFRLLGVRERAAHIANNVAVLIAAIGVFIIVHLLFGKPRAALLASAFYMGTPMVLLWSATAAAEPSSAAFGVAAVAAMAIFLRTRSTAALLLTAASLAFGTQFRPESVLLPLPVFLLLVLKAPGEFRRPRLYWAGLLFVILALPMLLHLYAVRGEGWGSGGNKFAAGSFLPNLMVNGPFYLSNEKYPLLFTLFAALGFCRPSHWREKIPILVWFLLFWGIFLVFYAGSYEYGADVRFSLVSAAPLAVMAGLGAAWVFDAAESARLASWGGLGAKAAVVVVAVAAWSRFLPLIRAVGEEAVDARLDLEYGRELAKVVPVDSIVLAHDPCMWLMWGKNSAQLSTATDNKPHVDNDLFARYKGGVYMHWGFWCNVPDPGQNQFGHNVRRDYDTDLVKAFDARGFHYALYRIWPKGGARKVGGSAQQSVELRP